MKIQEKFKKKCKKPEKTNLQHQNGKRQGQASKHSH